MTSEIKKVLKQAVRELVDESASLIETIRLKKLNEIEILDTAPEPVYDEIVQLAAAMCSTPSSFISYLDETRAWTKASFNGPKRTVPRNESFCEITISSEEPLVVENAEIDSRFLHLSAVKKGVVRYYLGVPLIKDGYRVGCLAVIDSVPRKARTEDIENLQRLASIVMLIKPKSGPELTRRGD